LRELEEVLEVEEEVGGEGMLKKVKESLLDFVLPS
jgi:NTP pyrophosphatase (non-canonical NTP hydrolase)